MELNLLENGFRKLKDDIGKIGKWNWKDWKMELERLENEIENIGKYIWKLEIMENGIRKIGKWNWEHWKMKYKT